MEPNDALKRPYVFLLLAGAATITLFVADQLAVGGDIAWLKVLGVATLLLAALFMFAPFYYLSQYGQVGEGKHFIYTTQVVDRGVYAIVRHPQYLGYALLDLGFALLYQSWATAVPAALAILFFYLQVMQEERFCVYQMGADYEAYCTRVPRFNFLLGIIRFFS